MYTIKQPSEIIIGKNSVQKYDFLENSLLITSSGAKRREWLSYLKIEPKLIIDDVESNPSIDTIEKILEMYQIY